jgi:hypothetical protein
MSDPRFMTSEEIEAGLGPILLSASVGIARKDRHDPKSQILMLLIEVERLSYDAMTQVAGLFQTPNIVIESKVCPVDDEQCDALPCSRVVLRVRW